MFDLGDFVSEAVHSADTTHEANLSGIQIAHKMEHKVMVTSKIGPIVVGIRKYLQARPG